MSDKSKKEHSEEKSDVYTHLGQTTSSDIAACPNCGISKRWNNDCEHCAKPIINESP